MSVDTLLKYGNWSGPGWTAGIPASVFAGQGLARKIGHEDRAIDGIDRYDNFVAKAHDLNEYDAQDILRADLADLGLIDNGVRRAGKRDAYAEALVHGAGGEDLKRFGSYDHYQRKLADRNGTAAAQKRLSDAFVRYYTHLAYSNLQFALDCVLNDVNRLRNLRAGAARMAIQLLGAPHWFLAEAMKLELRSERLQARHATAFPVRGGPAAALEGGFVSPTASYFRVLHDEAHLPVLTPAALLGSSRDDLVDVFSELVGKAKHVKRTVLAKRIRDRSAGGFDTARALADFLETVRAPFSTRGR
jgi:hypothetical protein